MSKMTAFDKAWVIVKGGDGDCGLQSFNETKNPKATHKYCEDCETCIDEDCELSLPVHDHAFDHLCQECGDEQLRFFEAEAKRGGY